MTGEASTTPTIVVYFSILDDRYRCVSSANADSIEVVVGFDAIGVEKWSYADGLVALAVAGCIARVMRTDPTTDAGGRIVYGDAPKGGHS